MFLLVVMLVMRGMDMKLEIIDLVYVYLCGGPFWTYFCSHNLGFFFPVHNSI